MKKISIIIILSSIFLSSCLSVSHESTSNVWTKYYEDDGRLEKLTSGRYSGTNANSLLVGYFRIASSGREIDLLRYNKHKMFSLVDLETNQSAKKLDKLTIRSLRKSKAVKYYEFGNKMIESAVYQSKNGLCKDFNSSNGINVNFATTYIPNINNQPNDFFATLSQAQLANNKQAKIIKKELIKHLDDANVNTYVQKLADSHLSNLVQKDAEKLGSAVQYLCSLPIN